MTFSIRVGTSGWTYAHWKGVFYPDDQPKAKWLEYYAEEFNTVELNATFYRLPKETTFENWFRRTPGGFLWALKASRYITHVKRLTDVNEALKRFYDRAARLGSKLGPLLFQLPPSLPYDGLLARAFLAQLDPAFRHAVEVRHPSWLNSEFFRELQDNNTAFCISDTAGRYPYGEEITADFVYIRLHGSRKLYVSEYTREELEMWAKKIMGWGRETFLYFDNDFEGYAIRNAQMFKKIMKDQ